MTVRCSHDGYARLRGSPRHVRSLTMTHNALVIDDQVSGAFKRAEARFHVHPAVEVGEETPDSGNGVRSVLLRLPQAQTVRLEFEGGLVKREPTTWHPEFGVSVPNTCLVNELRGAIGRLRVTWSSSP